MENRRPEADGYFIGCTATSMIDAIEDVERLDKPVVNSNQAVLWAALRRLDITEPIAGLGRLFSAGPDTVKGADEQPPPQHAGGHDLDGPTRSRPMPATEPARSNRCSSGWTVVSARET